MARYDTVLWWLKRDFRLHDVPALREALHEARHVIPVFVVEPALLNSPETSAFHIAAWADAVGSLREALLPYGGNVLVLRGDAPDVFVRLRDAVPFDALYSHEEVGTEVTFARDRAVKRWCKAVGIPWHEHRQTAVFRGLRNRDERQDLWHRFMRERPLPRPDARDLARLTVPYTASNMAHPADQTLLRAETWGASLTDAQRDLRQRVTLTDAHATMRSFLGTRGMRYVGGISSPNHAFEAGSRMSVHLAWGTVSARMVSHATVRTIDAWRQSPHPDASRWTRSLEAFLSRLHWRDHFIQRLESEPAMEFRALHPAYESLPTVHRPHFTEAWLAGETGFPLVDACMRCARDTGFLNFRMRAMVTSFACHTLRMHWREVLYPLARLWADYEPGIHVSQVQMQAGVVGINTLRVYNPAKQMEEHDPEALFVKRWVPEVRDVHPRALIAHQETPQFGLPLPIVNWRAETKAMKTAYFTLRKRPETEAGVASVLARHGSRRSRSASA